MGVSSNGRLEGRPGASRNSGTEGLGTGPRICGTPKLHCGTLRPVYGGPLAAISLQLAQKRSYQDLKEFRVCLERESSGKRARFLQLVSLSRRLLD